MSEAEPLAPGRFRGAIAVWLVLIAYASLYPFLPLRLPATDAVLAMFSNGGINSVWQNYCLKGSQISFVNAANQPVLLGNSVIEAIDANVPVAQSSCMTCHAYASFGTGGAPNTKGLDNLVGNVDQSLLNGSITNDFIWGVLFAR